MTQIVLSIIAVVILFFLVVMVIDGNRFVIREYTVTNAKITKECKLVVLADLHNKQYGADNRKLMSAIDVIAPNYIMVAGDMLTAKPEKDYSKTASFMAKLAEKYPVYYGMGNHEYRMKIYPDVYGDKYEKYTSGLRKSGICTLENETMDVLDTNLSVSGIMIERKYYKRFEKHGMSDDYPKQLLGAGNKDKFKILLAHNPEYMKQYAAWGADLVLAGHVHGGIMRLPVLGGVVSPKLTLFPKYDGGEFREQDTTMILSRGLGTHTIPIRIFNPGELVVIHLKPCK